MSDEKIIEILEPGSEDEQEAREKRVRDKFWGKLKSVSRNIPMADELVAAYYCAMDNETPAKVRGTLLAALAYFILPLDLLPDFIAGFGFTDDMAVIVAAVTSVRSNITDAHRAAAKHALSSDEFTDDKDA